MKGSDAVIAILNRKNAARVFSTCMGGIRYGEEFMIARFRHRSARIAGQHIRG